MDAACLQVPDFLIALARRDHPALASRPVVVGGAPEEHAQVPACSAEAAAAGVTIGTALRRALALCPGAVFLPLQESFAHAEAARLADVVLARSPLVELIAPGHIHFEVRGLARLARMSDEQYLAELLESVQAETGLGAWLGAATTVFPAHAAATALPLVGATASQPRPPATTPKSGWVRVPPGQERDFLAHLPVEVLPVDPVMHVRLRLFGLDRVGQVAAIPLSALQAQFGPDGRRAWDLANGRDHSRIVARREEARITGEMDLPAPAASIEPLMAGTEALLHRALAHPDISGQAIRRLDWWLGLESGEQVARRAVFREPTSDAGHMLFVLRSKLDRLALEAAAISVGIALSGICSEYAHQANLWQVGPRRQRELEQAIAQLSARAGGPQVYRIVEVQPWSRIPERQLALVAFGS